MTQYETYIFFLCLIVFILLTTLSVVCITIIATLSLRLIRSGYDDDRIKADHAKKRLLEPNRFSGIVNHVFTFTICLIFTGMFLVSLWVQGNPDAPTGNIPVFRVVQTGSMAKKNEKNTYLDENGIDNQIQTFDLIKVEALPDEMDLELYDIVVYEVDDMLIVHRIVEIIEPNASHPDCRHFRLQGDAIEQPDRFPVTYDQMRGIYRGTRIPYIGSFILFMQSPAGWLCMLLIIIASIATPIIDKVISYERLNRLWLIDPYAYTVAVSKWSKWRDK